MSCCDAPIDVYALTEQLRSRNNEFEDLPESDDPVEIRNQVRAQSSIIDAH